MAAAFAQWPEAVATTLEIAERCNVEIELGKMLIPRFPTPEGEPEEAMLRRLAHEGLRRRYGDPPPAEAVERLELELGVIEKMGFSAYFLIVWDFVKFAKDSGIAVGPGPRIGGGLDRLLLPPDHRRRPDRVRAAVRALPERRADLDAGHRHRLLGQGPRPRDPVRRRQVRPRVGRADHHLRPHVPARGHARRGARARVRLRSRRPPGQADPRADHGALQVVRPVPGRGGRPAARLRLRARGAPDHRGGQGPRGDRPQLVDPCRGGRDRRQAADRHRAAAARRGQERARRGRASAPTARSRSTR